MNQIVVRSAILSGFLLAAQSVSATPSALLFKCSNSTGSTGRLAFVPAPETAEDSEYTPRVMLRPGSDLWNLMARVEFTEVQQPASPAPVVYLLDGKVIEESAYQEVTKEIKRIFVSCSGAAHEPLGIEPGHTLVVAFTYPVQDLLRKEMEAIEVLQADFVKTHGRFAASLAELGWKAADPASWAVELTVSEDGSSWEARGRHVLVDEGDSLTVSGAR